MVRKKDSRAAENVRRAVSQGARRLVEESTLPVVTENQTVVFGQHLTGRQALTMKGKFVNQRRFRAAQESDMKFDVPVLGRGLGW